MLTFLKSALSDMLPTGPFPSSGRLCLIIIIFLVAIGALSATGLLLFLGIKQGKIPETIGGFSSLLEILGFFASILYGVAKVPASIQAIKDKVLGDSTASSQSSAPTP